MKVLLASDGSASAMEATRFLERLPFQQPPEVLVVTVSQQSEESRHETQQAWFPSWLKQQQEYLNTHQDDLQQQFAGKFQSVKSIQRQGHAARVILDEAETNDVDLIVMGATGHSTIGRMVLGSVSDSVATHAKCSVLVVRAPVSNAGERAKAEETDTAENSVFSGSPLTPPESMTIAYDGSSAAKEAIAEITSLAWPQATHVTLLSISPIYDYMMGDGMAALAMENEQAVNDALRETLEEVQARISGAWPNNEARVEKGRHVGDSIVDVATQQHSDLVVIGDAGHSLLHDWILGSTTKYVLRHAPCSVWISRHHRSADA